MKARATHPPSADAIERYRRAGYWQPTQTRTAHLTAIAAGGSRTALVDDDGQWSYDQLIAAVSHVDQSLTRARVTAGDAVLIIAPLRKPAAAAYLGVVLHGAVAVLLDRRCGQADVINAVEAASPGVALAFDDDAWRLELAQQCDVISLDLPRGHRESTAPSAISDLDPDAPAVVLFTSGTTSAPKGVVHTINSLRCGTANMISALGIEGDDGFFLSSPLASITGVLQLESTLTMHANMILQERFSVQHALDQVCEHGATVIGGAPFIAESILDEAGRQNRSIPLRCIAVGGSMVPQSVLDKAAAFGIRAVRVYGSSEVPFSTATDPDGLEAASDDGAPMPGVEVGLRGPDELVIRGPHQFHGYLDPLHGEGAFSDGWVRTGDQADIENGRVRIKGRLKEVVIRKGMKISLAEIDVAAAGLGDCAAFAAPDDATGERLALAISSVDADAVSYLGVVRHLTSTGLAKWKLPEQIVVWDHSLPRTSTGKVNRRELADQSRHQRSLYAPRLNN